ncbi:hypothetical protein FNJ88_02465 [Chryseobacterium sp. SNU WT5]|uniref:hypothetical protein n=1 Tax=Chryseobacterium sp. SNU WT5 TaxID=2594269 RepID=UPI0011801CF2|nr:hypothetical protein [Chryseobacterium sp. SNU WT5]QDP84472.1 hypothetical protein FNJ88_02465 [Chryseobacterium sp. SNU WT5]
MYLTKKDVQILNDLLNQEEQIAFLVSNGNRKWIAKNEHNILEEIERQNSDFGFVEYKLWHIPSGPLPLFDHINSGKKIVNPFEGWTEITSGADLDVPYFGAGHPGVISLEIKINNVGEIPMSSFGWIGNHYKIIGNGSEKVTEKFWSKLRRTIKNLSKQIPRCNQSSCKNEVFTFANALKEIENGCECALNP